MGERRSRRFILKSLALGGAAAAGLFPMTGVDKSLFEDQRTLEIERIREELRVIGENDVAVELDNQVVDTEEEVNSAPVEIRQVLVKPNWPIEVLLKPVRLGPNDRPLVGLTIDDGFLARDEVLDALVYKNVRATFFVIGKVAVTDPQFIRRALDLDFEFGNHTFTHGDLTTMSKQQMISDIKRAEVALVSIDERARPVPFLRPPGGARNSFTDSIVASMGYRSINWNVSGDTGATYTPDQLLRLYLDDQFYKSRPWGSIMLIHFNGRTAEALGGIIDGIRSLGMEPVPLSQLYEGGRV